MVPFHEKWAAGFDRHLAARNVLSTRTTTLFDFAFRSRTIEDEALAPDWAEVRAILQPSVRISSFPKEGVQFLRGPAPSASGLTASLAPNRSSNRKGKKVLPAHKDRQSLTPCPALF